MNHTLKCWVLLKTMARERYIRVLDALKYGYEDGLGVIKRGGGEVSTLLVPV